MAARDFGVIRRVVEQFLFGDPGQAFPWVADLSPPDRAEFRAALEGLWRAALPSGRWGEVREFLEDWEATAEVVRDRKRANFLKRPPEEKEYWDDQLVPLSAIPVGTLGVANSSQFCYHSSSRTDVRGLSL